MSDFAAVDKTIQNGLAADAGVGAIVTEFVTGKPSVFVGMAPKGAKMPYIRVHFLFGGPDDTHSSRGELLYYQISCFARTELAVRDLMSAVDNVLHPKKDEDKAAIVETAIDGYDWVYCKRHDGPRGNIEMPEEIYHAHADYEVMVEES